jgi:hypothetical protein
MELIEIDQQAFAAFLAFAFALGVALGAVLTAYARRIEEKQ